MQKAEQRGADLKAKLSAMLQAAFSLQLPYALEANESNEALQLEEENLRLEVAAKAQSQAKDGHSLAIGPVFFFQFFLLFSILVIYLCVCLFSFFFCVFVCLLVCLFVLHSLIRHRRYGRERMIKGITSTLKLVRTCMRRRSSRCSLTKPRLSVTSLSSSIRLVL